MTPPMPGHRTDQLASAMREEWVALARKMINDAIMASLTILHAIPPMPGSVDPPMVAPVEQHRWSEARLEVLRRAWPLGVPTTEILALVNDLPGPAITSFGAIDAKARTLQLHRPTMAVRLAVRQAQAAPAECEKPAAAPTVKQAVPSAVPAPEGVLCVTYATALAWAGQRGLAPVRDGMDLDQVNRKRVALGLPPFRIVRTTALTLATPSSPVQETVA